MASFKLTAETEAMALLRRHDITPEATALAVQAIAILALCESIESLGNSVDEAVADGRLRLDVQVENQGGNPFHVETRE